MMKKNIQETIFGKKFSSQKGAALLIAVFFFLVISVTIIVGSSGPVIADRKAAQNLIKSKASYFASEAGVEDVSYRIIKSKNYDDSENLTLDGYSASTNVVDVDDGKEVTTTGNAANLIRKNKVKLATGSGASFYYGVQVGNGGIVMSNSSEVRGNVFSNGPVNGYNSNVIRGDVIAAGPAGLIDGVHSTSSAYAHTIMNSNIEKDAHYQTISGTTVGGVSYPGSPDQAASSLPISDVQIEEWKAEALAGGVITSPCPYIVSGTVSIGPKKINCDLYVDGTDIVTLNDNVWVSGNIIFSNSAQLKINPSLGDKTVAVIADKETNRSSSGQIYLSNSTEFFGSGNDRSYILLISRNNSAETGGSNPAISLSNSAQGKVLLYAPHGMIYLSNSISVKEASAYKISLANSANVIYETGIANLLFTSGPSGGYSIDSWRETQ